MERFMLLCDSCQNRNQNGNGHVSSDKKWIPNSFIKKGNFYFFLSCPCAKSNRRGNIGFCKEADNGASCLHCQWWEGSHQFAGRVTMAPFSRLAAPWEGSSFLSSFLFFLSPSLSLSFFPSFLPFGTWLFLALTQLSGGFRDHALQHSMLDSSCQARCKLLFRSYRLQTSADSPWVSPASSPLDRARTLPQNMNFILYM